MNVTSFRSDLKLQLEELKKDFLIKKKVSLLENKTKILEKDLETEKYLRVQSTRQKV